MILAELLDETGIRDRQACAAEHAHEAQIDVALAQPREDELERVDARGVELTGRLEVEEHDAGARVRVDRAENAVMDLRCGRPEGRHVEPQHQAAVVSASLGGVGTSRGRRTR